MTPPRVFCDFNKQLERDVYGLNTRGTAADLARLRLSLEPGMRLTLYDYDANDRGERAWLLADAVVVELPERGLVARVAPESFRWEPRAD